MRVLVLGATGMLGSAVFGVFRQDSKYETWGTLRNGNGKSHFEVCARGNLKGNINVLDRDVLLDVFASLRPNAVINCIGLVKQLDDARNPLAALPINAMLPHQLANLCALTEARLIHISTDCVFSGRQGGYREFDSSDAEDLYGKSKYLGEIIDRPHVITLRTSIIGHELKSKNGLVDWFLSQEGEVRGFSRAVFSGLPTVELARVIKNVVLPRPALSGLYHVAASPISKLDLLRLIALQYGKGNVIVADDQVVVDRSLDPSRFQAETGYAAADWPELIERMHSSR